MKIKINEKCFIQIVQEKNRNQSQMRLESLQSIRWAHPVL
jgi:hypothetical protein